jgi:hypothetical protein
VRALQLTAGSVEDGQLAMDTWGSWILANQHKVRTLRVWMPR